MNKALCILTVAAIAGLADELVKPQRAGLTIDSQNVTFQMKDKVAIYTGNVVVVDPPQKTNELPTIVKCAVLTAKLATNGGFETIVAEKDVRISQGEQLATGDRAIYTKATEELVLYRGEKPAMLYYPPVTNWVDRIIYNRTNNNLRIEGNVKTEAPGESLKAVQSTNSPADKSKLRPPQ